MRLRFLQHKEEAYWFYRYLSIIYDRFINPWFETSEMIQSALSVAQLNRSDLEVAEVGAGTGFATEQIVKFVAPSHIHALDQSDYQQDKAKKRASITGVRFYLGDAENLPWECDRFDRYVSCGSIEYWPDPQRAIAEAYRVIKEGGFATIIGPLEPEHPVARFVANVFMLFPTKDQYLHWYKEAGFVDIRYVCIRPKWVAQEDYAISIVGRKPAAGTSPWMASGQAPFPVESLQGKSSSSQSLLLFLFRFAVGSFAGALFVPLAWIKTAIGKMASADR